MSLRVAVSQRQPGSTHGPSGFVYYPPPHTAPVLPSLDHFEGAPRHGYFIRRCFSMYLKSIKVVLGPHIVLGLLSLF